MNKEAWHPGQTGACAEFVRAPSATEPQPQRTEYVCTGAGACLRKTLAAVVSQPDMEPRLFDGNATTAFDYQEAVAAGQWGGKPGGAGAETIMSPDQPSGNSREYQCSAIDRRSHEEIARIRPRRMAGKFIFANAERFATIGRPRRHFVTPRMGFNRAASQCEIGGFERTDDEDA
jgi:hypothetical protein